MTSAYNQRMNQRGHYGTPRIGAARPENKPSEPPPTSPFPSKYELEHRPEFMPLVLVVLGVGVVASIAYSTRRGKAVVDFFTKERG